jgi:hypothetical protein
MQLSGSGLLRIRLPRTPVNKEVRAWRRECQQNGPEVSRAVLRACLVGGPCARAVPATRL